MKCSVHRSFLSSVEVRSVLPSKLNTGTVAFSLVHSCTLVTGKVLSCCHCLHAVVFLQLVVATIFLSFVVACS